ncbi:MAG: hypothetical protein ACLVLP_09840 [Phascolarctobacterium faecium]|uniref:hypothetical protein n=1 Tax=Phascolarctobacterium faecium TaxID=33025 RepID=UPI003999732F
MMLKIEMLTVETVGALKPLLLELADYHNQTALNFRGLYPLVCADEKIRTLQRGNQRRQNCRSSSGC